MAIKVSQNFDLKKLLSTNPMMRQALEYETRKIMWQARNEVVKGVSPYMYDSTHDTYRAIRNIVYKRVIGGELNILNVKRALRQGSVKPSRRGRTQDTERILSYTGVDRAFIFRFINDRTGERVTTNMDGHKMYRKSKDERPKNREYKSEILGYRGGAARRNSRTVGIFEKEAGPVMADVAMVRFEEMVNRLIDQQLNKI